MKRLIREMRCNTQSNSGMISNSKCEKHCQIKDNSSMGFFESMAMIK